MVAGLNMGWNLGPFIHALFFALKRLDLVGQQGSRQPARGRGRNAGLGLRVCNRQWWGSWR